MSLEVLTYPFIFFGLYFEIFMLVTFLSLPAKSRRDRVSTTTYPTVAIIVPCWNEETTVAGTVQSLLALEYPKDKLSIFLVDDGSLDNTWNVIKTFEKYQNIRVFHKENGGKHTAINLGIERAHKFEFFGCLDADSFVAPDALKEMMSSFTSPQIAASTPAMSVFKPKNFLERIQNAEYIFGITVRHILSAVNGIYVTPGPFSVYRRDIVEQLGGFRHAHQAEDMEMALRMQRAGYEIENAPRARVYTKVPHTIPKLIKQRTRWTTGFLRNVLLDYRDLFSSPKNRILGSVVLPLGFISIVGGVGLFFVSLYVIGHNALHTYLFINSGVPLAFFFQPHFSADWFYTPLTFVSVISSLVFALSLSFISVGRRISGTESFSITGILGYAFLYGFIAPFWLMRSLFDLITGNKRAWR